MAFPIAVSANDPLPTIEPIVVTNPFNAASRDVGNAQNKAGVGGGSLEAIVGKIIQGILSLVGVIFFALMVYAGYLWMTAHGEEEKITQAKKMISGAIIGLAITLAAYAVTFFVVGRLTSAETGALQAPAASPPASP